MSCLMEGCTSTKRSCKNTSITFFSFPNIPAMRAKWIWACNVKFLPKKAFVCSEHFDEKKDIVKRIPPRLNRGAFPLPPEGCYRRKIALSLGDNNTVFFKGNSGIIILNPNQNPMRLTKFAEDSNDTGSLSQISNSTETQFDYEPQSQEVACNQRGEEFCVEDAEEFLATDDQCEEIEDMDECLDIEQLDDTYEEFLHTGSEDEHVATRTNQYFKCCVRGCNNTSTNSDIKFYKFRTDEFSRSMWCEKIGMNEALVHSNTKICANHFLYPNDFKADGNLKPYTVPAVNLPDGPVLVQKIIPVRARKS